MRHAPSAREPVSRVPSQSRVAPYNFMEEFGTMKNEREVKLISRRASDIELPERKKRWGKFYLKGK